MRAERAVGGWTWAALAFGVLVIAVPEWTLDVLAAMPGLGVAAGAILALGAGQATRRGR